MRAAVYPGSFDPITFGHLDILGRAAEAFDKIIVAVLANPRKKPLLDSNERLAVIRESLMVAVPELVHRIDVEAFDGLTVEFCRARDVRFIVRGLRAVSDFETEMQLANNNRHLAPEIDTVCFMASPGQSYVSSSRVREIAQFSGDVSSLVPPAAVAALRRAFRTG